MPLDIYLTPTNSADRNGQMLIAAVRKIHHNGGGKLHAPTSANYSLPDSTFLPADVELVFDWPETGNFNWQEEAPDAT